MSIMTVRQRPNPAPTRDNEPNLCLSARLALLAEASGERLSLQELVTGLGEQSFGSVMLVMAIPATVMPPVVSAVVGGPLLVVSAQLLAGSVAPRLPGPLGRLSLPGDRVRSVLGRAARRMAGLERMSRPRLQVLLHPIHIRIAALACLAMSLVMCLPTPMAHSAAGLSIGAFATALVQRDGLAMVAGWALAMGCAVILGLFAAVALRLH